MSTSTGVVDNESVFEQAVAAVMREAGLDDYGFLADALRNVRTWVLVGAPDLGQIMPRSSAELALGAYEKVKEVQTAIDTIKDSTATLTLKIASDTSGLAPIFQEILKYSSVAQLLESVGQKNGGSTPGNNTRTAATTRNTKR